MAGIPLPDFIAKMTGAAAQAGTSPGGMPTWGDAAQDIGHSMMEHFRAGQQPPVAGATPMAPQQIGMPVSQTAQIMGAPITGKAPPVAQPNFMRPDLQAMIQSGAPQVGMPAPLAGSDLSQIARLFQQ